MSKKNIWIDRLATLVLKYQILIFLVCGVVTIGACFALPKLKVDTDFLHFMPQDHTDVLFFNDVGETFGSNYMAMIAIQSDDVFNHNVLTQVRKITQDVSAIDGISDVMSLTKILNIKKTEDGIEVGDLISQKAIPINKEELAKLKTYTLSKEMYTSSIVSKDGKTTSIIIRLAADAEKDVVSAKIRSSVNDFEGGKVYFAGFPMVMDYMAKTIEKDMVKLIPFVVGLVLFILFFTFRSFSGVVLPMLTVLLGSLWTLATMALFGTPITMISSMMLVILIATGTAYSIHMLNAVYHEYLHATEEEKFEALREAYQKVGLAMVLAGVTTSIGFFSLQSSTMTLFAEFGLFSAIGVIYTLGLSVTLIPAILSKLKIKNLKIKEEQEDSNSLADRSMIMLANFVYHKKGVVVSLALVTVILAIFGVVKIESEMNMIAFLPNDSEPRVAERLIKKEFGGSTVMSVHIGADVKSPIVLDEMIRFQKRIRVLPHVFEPQSVADLILEMNESLNDRRVIPATKGGVSSLWLLIEGKSIFKQLISANEQRAMIQGRIDNSDTATLKKVIQAANELIQSDFRSELTYIHSTDLDEGLKDKFADYLINEVVENIRLDLLYREGKISDVESLRKYLKVEFLLSNFQLPVDTKIEVFSDYLSSLDAEIELGNQELIQMLSMAVANLENLNEVTVFETLETYLPRDIFLDDEEGVQLLAESLENIYINKFSMEKITFIYNRISSYIYLAENQYTKKFDDEIKGNLWTLTKSEWAITPALYNSLLGYSPKGEDVIHLEARQTGFPMIMKALVDELTFSQISSLGLASLLVSIILMILLKSIIGGLIASVPVLFTIGINFGIMGILGIPLDNATVLVASISIGIGIDYTIHIIGRLKREYILTDSDLIALQNTLKSAGKAVVINTVAVTAGFIVLLASDLIPLQRFGWLTALCMILSAIGAMTLFPALTFMLKAKFLKPNI